MNDLNAAAPSPAIPSRSLDGLPRRADDSAPQGHVDDGVLLDEALLLAQQLRRDRRRMRLRHLDDRGEPTGGRGRAAGGESFEQAWIGFLEVGVRVDAARNEPQTGGVDALRGRPVAGVECQRGDPLVRNDDVRREHATFADDRPVLDDDIGACHAVPVCFRSWVDPASFAAKRYPAAGDAPNGAAIWRSLPGADQQTDSLTAPERCIGFRT